MATKKEMEDTAELEVRRYFDHFLEKVYPKLMLEHTHACKHGQFINKFKWVMVGMTVTFVLLFPTLGKGIVSLILKLIG